ncbi:hypothetical protein SSAG_00885 [Streptomyces sp. Mg1]|nr:hypothetical protein SSAG_00885 [Streptomyces sp. Mg1]
MITYQVVVRRERVYIVQIIPRNGDPPVKTPSSMWHCPVRRGQSPR